MSHRIFHFHRIAAAALAVVTGTSCFSRGAVHSYRTEEGRPLADPGPADAYLVWHDGAAWHLRARSEAGHRFEGRIEAGRLERLAPVGVEPSALQAGDDAVAFSFVPAAAGEVGFDWRGGCAEFSLYVDGDARPLRIFAGAYGASPPRIPFELCP
jgi:hypothetical protein